MKFADLPTTDRKGRALESVENGIIKSVSLSNEDHGCLSGWLFLEFGCGGCGFGGYSIGKADGGNLASPGNYAAEWIVRCINVVIGRWGKWEDLPGQPVRVLSEGTGGQIVAIGHFLKDEWFCPRVEFEQAKATAVIG